MTLEDVMRNHLLCMQHLVVLLWIFTQLAGLTISDIW